MSNDRAEQSQDLCRPLGDGSIQCLLCQRRCKISQGKVGYCKTKKNRDGRLWSVIYGRVSSVRISPIEIKPIYHYYPGSLWLSLGSVGCNFLCPGCQNWEIAHADVDKVLPALRYVSPEEAVQQALDGNCKGLSWTYNEPTLWYEYTLDTNKLAKKKGLLTNYVTNGAMTLPALDMLGPYLDAFRVDLKGFSKRTYQRLANIADFQGILKTIVRAKDRWGMHVEIVTNVIPGFNDDEAELRPMARWIMEHMGPETPWHLTRFYPHHELDELEPTPVVQLESIRRTGMEEGLLYVYLGNVPGHEAGNTYCPACGDMVIQRFHCEVVQCRLHGNRCAACGHEISGCFTV